MSEDRFPSLVMVVVGAVFVACIVAVLIESVSKHDVVRSCIERGHEPAECAALAKPN